MKAAPVAVGVTPLEALLPISRWQTALASATSKRGAEVDGLAALYEAHRAAPAARFFRAAWERGALEAAARLCLGVVDRHDGVHEVKELTVDPDEVVVVPGSLRAAEGVFNQGLLFVAGDLDAGSSLEDDGVGRVALVTGALSTAVVRVRGGVRVDGDLRVERLVYAESDEDRLSVGGLFECPLTVLDGKTLQAKRVKGLVAQSSMSFGELRRLAGRLDPSLLLEDAALDEDGDDDEELALEEFVDLEALYTAAREGRPLLRPAQRRKRPRR